MYKYIPRGPDQQYSLIEYGGKSVSKGIHEEDHTPIDNGVVEGQSEEFITTENKVELAHGDRQQEVVEKHSGEILTKWNEEIELLEKMLI